MPQIPGVNDQLYKSPGVFATVQLQAQIMCVLRVAFQRPVPRRAPRPPIPARQ